MKLIIVGVFLLVCLYTEAQSGKISGTVTDQFGDPVVGANIFITGTSTGTITNFDGYYEISGIKIDNYQVQCSFISYTPQTIEIDLLKKAEIVVNFILLENITQLSEVQIEAKANKESENLPQTAYIGVNFPTIQLKLPKERKLAIIIPTKNNVDKLLIPCIESIISNTTTRMHIISFKTNANKSVISQRLTTNN